jgi:SPP1 gp7 family putative phage head morphogenesis protein
VGYSPTLEMYDPGLAHSLKYNIAQFSAFKETSFREQLEAALTSNGKVRSWSEFKNKADELNIAYNRRWLRTEYDQTVATANMAEQWKDFEANADLYPNLKYEAVGDGRTREQHKAWDGLILPIKHEFWKTHLPPNDWGCRCTVTQSDDKPTVEPPEIATKGIFKNNAALSGKIFNDIPYEKGLSSAEVKEVEKQAKRNFNDERKKLDKALLDEVKIKRGSFLSFKNTNFINEVRVSKSNLENILNHIPLLENKEIIKDLDTIMRDAKFIEFKALDNTKDSKNYGKKIGRGVKGYNYYLSTWRGVPIQIDMEVMKNGHEQPYAILINKK